MSGMSPEEFATQTRTAQENLKAQANYRVSGAEMIKNEGNQLHNSGKYEEAAAKYLLAKTNLEGETSPQVTSQPRPRQGPHALGPPP